jgi:hypothetical protein
MGIRLEGVDELMTILQQTGEKAQRGVYQQMKKEALEIQRLARLYAPIDHGNLEDAISVEEMEGERDSRGRMGRKSVVVFVDMSQEGYEGEPIGQYAYIMHEYLAPYGKFKLGPLSQLKNKGNGKVGGKFLERAINDVSQEMMKRLVDVARTYY